MHNRVLVLLWLILSSAQSLAASGDECSEGIKELLAFSRGEIPTNEAPGMNVLVPETPRVPLRGPQLNKPNITSIMSRVPKKFEKDYEFLIDQIRKGRISHTEFRGELDRVAKQFAKKHKQKLHDGKMAFFNPKEHIDDGRDLKIFDKSNGWTSQLIMQRNKELGFPEALPSFASAHHMGRLAKKKGISDFVITDDAVYSGSQMTHFLQEVASQTRHTGNPVNIHLVIPYMTRKGKREIENAAKDLPFRVHFYGPKKIKSFREVANKAVKDKVIPRSTLNRLRQWFTMDDGQTLSYFDHIVPDSVSTVSDPATGYSIIHSLRTPRNDGTLWDREGIPVLRTVIPPYKK